MDIAYYPKYRLLGGKVVLALRNFPLICDKQKRVWVEDLNGYTRFIRVKVIESLAIVPKTKQKRKKPSVRKQPSKKNTYLVHEDEEEVI